MDPRRTYGATRLAAGRRPGHPRGEAGQRAGRPPVASHHTSRAEVFGGPVRVEALAVTFRAVAVAGPGHAPVTVAVRHAACRAEPGGILEPDGIRAVVGPGHGEGFG